MTETTQQAQSVDDSPVALPVTASLPSMHGRFDIGSMASNSRQMTPGYMQTDGTRQGKLSPTPLWCRQPCHTRTVKLGLEA